MTTLTVPSLVRPVWLAAARVRYGRPRTFAGRVLAAFAMAHIAVRSGPAAVADALAGIVTWVAVTARHDVAPPTGR